MNTDDLLYHINSRFDRTDTKIDVMREELARIPVRCERNDGRIAQLEREHRTGKYVIISLFLTIVGAVAAGVVRWYI